MTTRTMERFFVCGVCGREFSFAGSFLCVPAGGTFRRLGSETPETATVPTCRHCAGQTEKLPSGGEAELLAEASAAERELGLARGK